MVDPIVHTPSAHTRWQLAEIGPIVKQVLVALHPETGKALRKAGQSIPDPQPLDALVDTGSDICLIRQTLATQLKLQEIDALKMTAAHGKTQLVPVYYANIPLPLGLKPPLRAPSMVLGGWDHGSRVTQRHTG